MIRLLIADDHPIVREGLKRIIDECSDMELVGEAVDGQEVLNVCEQEHIDVLLLDISMPGPGFLEILRRLGDKYPLMRILVLSIFPEENYAIRAIKSGASGYLTKNHTTNELADAVRLVHKGDRYISRSMAENLVSNLEDKTDTPSHEKLSKREYQIFLLIGEGKNTNEIAYRLSLSPKTVNTYRSRIKEKMNLTTNAEIIHYALKHQLID